MSIVGFYQKNARQNEHRGGVFTFEVICQESFIIQNSVVGELGKTALEPID
jgi:hypothetical protein